MAVSDVVREPCGDVRLLLGEVFRGVAEPLPLADRTSPQRTVQDNNSAKIQIDNPILKKTSEFEIRLHEDKLKHEFASKVSEAPRESEQEACPGTSRHSEWNEKFAIIRRKDLMPTSLENVDQQRWRWSITKARSDSVSTAQRSEHLHVPAYDSGLPHENFTIQSVSHGEAAESTAALPQPGLPLPTPRCVVCEPARIYFVNFTVGREHVRSVRLVNISRQAVRLALRPPARTELSVALRGRGLTVTSGSTLDLRVHFKPRDVRAFQDEVFVRVSQGRAVVLPILCYMEPPVLDVIVPSGEPGEPCCAWGLAGLARSPLLELGARLAGAPHRVPLRLACSAPHASFYLMSEDAWCSFAIDEAAIRTGYVVVGAFSVGPVRWHGERLGQAACRAPSPGLRTAALRLLSSTAVVRPLTIIADSVMFSIDHITLKTQEKDYDILLEGDPACLYYVHLGTAFPDEPLAASVQLVNHSSVSYSYYWSVRPWDKTLLSAEKRQSEIFSEVIESESVSLNTESVSMIRVEPVRGSVAARSAGAVHVCAPHAGAECGLHRLVLMLILTDVPRECLSPEHDGIIVSTDTVEEEEIPGLCEPWSRTVCEVVCTQMEVWWEVVPLRFVLHPPLLTLEHVAKVSSVEVPIEVTQLHGAGGAGGAGCAAGAAWRGDVVPQAPLPPLLPGRSVRHVLRVPLSGAHDETTTNIFQLEATEGVWRAWCVVRSRCITPHAALLPPSRRLGAGPPATALATAFTVVNNTHAMMNWRVSIYPWWSLGGARCTSGGGCGTCSSSCCACDALAPVAGALPHDHTENVTYQCHAPFLEGNVVNIVQLRTEPGGGPARSSLLSHRTLLPRLMLRALRCGCARRCHCEECKQGTDGGEAWGAAVLRPRCALLAGRREAFLLRCVNLTPVPTALCWDITEQYSDALIVTFSPARCELDAFATVTIQVTLEAVAPYARRVLACRAAVRHTEAPLYLLLDTAADGRKVSIEIPLGGDDDSMATITRSERGVTPWSSRDAGSLSAEETFNDFEQMRTKMKVKAVASAPRSVRPCPCFVLSSQRAEAERRTPPCLQFPQVPLGSELSLQLTLRNESTLPVRWRVVVRRWPRTRPPSLLNGQCREVVEGAGVRVHCAPAGGELRAADVARLTVSVRGDTWGLYRDQLLIQFENMEPVFVDVWVEVVGAPLHFALRPDGSSNKPPVLWEKCGLKVDVMKIFESVAVPVGDVPEGLTSIRLLTYYRKAMQEVPVVDERMYVHMLVGYGMTTTDPARRLQVTNTSRSHLAVQTFVLKDHEIVRDSFPLRLYLRFYDVEQQEISLEDREGYIASFKNNSSSHDLSEDRISTGIELIISGDYGLQVETMFEVEPNEFMVAAGERASQTVRVRCSAVPSAAAATSLLLLTKPVQRCGVGWYRADPPPQVAGLRIGGRAGLQLSRDFLSVQLSALHLPDGDVTRVRKYLHALNVGEESLALSAITASPWKVFISKNVDSSCVSGCSENSECLLLDLPPQSSVELCAELLLPTEAVWAPVGEGHASSQVADTDLNFYDGDKVLLARAVLSLAVEVPELRAQPSCCDFGFVALNDCRKTYFTVTHNSSLCPVEAAVQYEGDEEFAAWPARLALPPHCSGRVYVQYTARRCDVQAEGVVWVRAAGSAGRWCSARVILRAASTRDRARSIPVHDHTDNDCLLLT